MALAQAVNIISRFLSAEDIRSTDDLEAVLSTANGKSTSSPPTDVVVLCASAVLDTADIVFTALSELRTRKEASYSSGETRLVVVLCGGKGHSTALMHEAVARHPRHRELTEQTQNLPEARILQAIAEQYYGINVNCEPTNDGSVSSSSRHGMMVLVEDQSTNCGANASKTRKLLEAHGITDPRSIVVSQDPTMCRRTLASFEKVYEDVRPHLHGWPTFVPQVEMQPTSPGEKEKYRLRFNKEKTGVINDSMLWTMDRFCALITGEIPRIRDDKDGYGPRGKGFISHVAIPKDVLQAWETLTSEVGLTTRQPI